MPVSASQQPPVDGAQPTAVAYADWVLGCEVEATREAHLAGGPSAPETCRCLPCRNFLAAHDTVYPPVIRELLRQLGVDPPREAAVYWIARLAPGRHLYGGWLHFFGRVTREGAPRTETHGGVAGGEPLRFSVAFHERAIHLGPGFRDRPVVQAELTAEAPWVLAEPEPVE
jgi:hypothetical protein